MNYLKIWNFNVPAVMQTISYTSTERPLHITDSGYEATFTYNADNERVMMTAERNDTAFTKYYLGGCYEVETRGGVDILRLYVGGDYYSAPAVLVRRNGVDSLYYIIRDNIGSIVSIVSAGGTVIEENRFDAWGRILRPTDGQPFDSTHEPNLFLGRGYCGHEHL